jgi:hypothetical protein
MESVKDIHITSTYFILTLYQNQIEIRIEMVMAHCVTGIAGSSLEMDR